MPMRPLAPVNVQSLESVDDVLASLDAGLEGLMDMCKDQGSFDARELWTLDKNILFLKAQYDRAEVLISKEGQT